jgi:DNA polymerase-3 subunit gamma/tau
MSYQVLARKWRPRLFREMVGQEHVLQALINALDKGRLHHAYLFAGTRGVGKTTIARILAKCLNCESGVSSEPCGQCSACTEIAEGRFVDLIEVDAASRTKVEDTRELLENVQYAPTRGRYKVYLIDEVHMLSNSSFNALLKTLEEPPPHVKFLLATTDPQKLPVTVLSRCLQFNLKNMSPERVVEHLRFVLEQEMVPFEEGALWHLGRAADGSMRDAMSLTDQAIAFGGGVISEAEVRAMLGTLDTGLVWKLVQALAAESALELFAAVDELAQQAPDYSGALAELASILHRIAVAQVLPQAVDNTLGDGERLHQYAANLAPENVQLYYQMALLARRDLPMAPEPRSGFEMALLRMLAFRPQGVAEIPVARIGTREEIAAEKKSLTETASAEVGEPPVDSEPVVEPPKVSTAESTEVAAEALAREPAPAIAKEIEPVVDRAAGERAALRAQLQQQVAEVQAAPPPPQTPSPDNQIPSPDAPKARLEALSPGSWPTLYSQLGISGILHSIASHLELVGRRENNLSFTLDQAYSSLYDDNHQRRLADLLGDFFRQPLTVQIQVGEIHGGTPARLAAATREARAVAARDALDQDPLVRDLKAELGAELVADSVEYLD